MRIEIKKDRCKECGFCVASCPKKCISFAPKINKIGYHPVVIDMEQCIKCGSCYTVCPDGVYHFIPGGDQ
ncbi:indolepyruvate ferredoxin oxidoreductase subunit alpha [Chakrabartyella piscis]|uniref:indolepyruvate ferredoxin oxidoreductase subunit alpha n=1 Tax=Chakrabartyella piscis TaxID=2918914 RepID=UPI0029587862|nr:4Fe-4S dicluster domain-containing protein [Chakrabartyella piscis]